MRATNEIVVRPDSVVRLDENGHIIRTPVSKWPAARDEPVYMLSQSYDAHGGRVYTVLTAWDGHNGTMLCRVEVRRRHTSIRQGTDLAKLILNTWMRSEKGYLQESEIYWSDKEQEGDDEG